jgi:hypothetical protein
MPRAEKTLEQLAEEIKKAKIAYEKKAEQERAKVIVAFFKDNPDIKTPEDYKNWKEQKPQPEKVEVEKIVEIEKSVEGKVPDQEPDQLAQMTKALFTKYADSFVMNGSEPSFNPRDDYFKFFKDFDEIKKAFASENGEGTYNSQL